MKRLLLTIIAIVLYAFNNHIYAKTYVTDSYENSYLVYAVLDESDPYNFMRWEQDSDTPTELCNLTDFRRRSMNDFVFYGSASSPNIITIEGLIWYKGRTPTYWDTDNGRIKDFWENKKGYGPATALAGNVFPFVPTYQHNPAGWDYGYRKGDQCPTMGRDTICPITGDWIHVWTTPEEALRHPADIEFYIQKPISLIEHLGVHYYVSPNDPEAETVSANGYIQTWYFNNNEIRNLGLIWEFDTLDYFNANTQTYDSRYIRIDHKTGLMEAQNIQENGATYEDETFTAVGREPLVRVRLYHINNGKDKPILDGYIRIHISRSKLFEINKYPAWIGTYEYGYDAQTASTSWSQFNRWVLTDEMDNMEKEQFDALFMVEQEGSVDDVNKKMELVQYVKSEKQIVQYNKLTVAPANWLPTKENMDEYKIGHFWTRYDEVGTTSHTYWWTISAKEMEALTHNLVPDEDVITIERYIHYTGHFYSSTVPNNAGAKYDDIFIKLSLNLRRTGVEPEQCAKPKIYYNNNWLSFSSDTEGVRFKYNITDSDVKSGSGNYIDLSVTYTISVYATREGYRDSELATATLCWIEVEPQKEGITDDDDDTDAMAGVKAVPVLIQSEGNQLIIKGAQAGTPITVYDLSGRLITTTTASENSTTVRVPIDEKVVVVKVGDKAVKVKR